MKTKIMICTIVLLSSVFTGSVWGGFEGTSNTFYGIGAGFNTNEENFYYDTFIGALAGYANTTGLYNTFLGWGAGQSNTTGSYNTFLGLAAGEANTTGNWNTFLGLEAGYSNTTGSFNTFLGIRAAYSNTTGSDNTFLGNYAGYSNTTSFSNTFLGLDTGKFNTTGNYNTFLGNNAGSSNTIGSGNVFLGRLAGYYETGSNKLYIDNSDTSTPLIYGEFDNNILTVYGNLEVIGPNNGLVYLSNTTNDNTAKVSRMVLNHYSNAQLPVYLFGAASTSTDNFVAFGGGNTIGNAATQLDLFTAENTTTPVGTPRITIKGNGYVGIGTQDPSYPLQMGGGAYSNGTSWIDISSREYKENIEVLSMEEALETIKELNPVKYAYKTDQTERRVGFISEEVPDLIAMKDRKGLSPMDIVAVLTKVVQDQQRVMQEQQKVAERQEKTISDLCEELKELKEKLR
jgi:hypothetical protein